VIGVILRFQVPCHGFGQTLEMSVVHTLGMRDKHIISGTVRLQQHKGSVYVSGACASAGARMTLT